MRNLFCTCLLLFAAGAASSEDCVPGAPFVGTWEWIESSGGIAGTTIGPADFGYTIQLEVRVDGTILSYRDEVLYGTSDMYPDCEGGMRLGAQPAIPGVELVSDCAPYIATVGPGPAGLEMQLLNMICFDGYNHRLRARAAVGTEWSDWSRLKAVYR